MAYRNSCIVPKDSHNGGAGVSACCTFNNFYNLFANKNKKTLKKTKFIKSYSPIISQSKFVFKCLKLILRVDLIFEVITYTYIFHSL